MRLGFNVSGAQRIWSIASALDVSVQSEPLNTVYAAQNSDSGKITPIIETKTAAMSKSKTIPRSKIPQDVNPDTIASFILADGCFEIQFKEKSLLKFKARSCSLYSDGKMQLGISTIPRSLAIGGEPAGGADLIADAVKALMSLGYAKGDAKRIATESAAELPATATIEDVVSRALGSGSKPTKQGSSAKPVNTAGSTAVNHEKIASFTLADGCFEIKFKDMSLLTFKASGCSFYSQGKLQVGKPVFPDSLIVNGGGKSADGKLRCAVCDCLLTDDNRIGKQHCWDCVTNSEKSPGGWSLVETVRVLGGKDPEGVVKKYLQSIEVEDPMNLVPEDHIQEIYRKKK